MYHLHKRGHNNAVYNRAYALAYYRAKRRGEPLPWCRRFGRVAGRLASGVKPRKIDIVTVQDRLDMND